MVCLCFSFDEWTVERSFKYWRCIACELLMLNERWCFSGRSMNGSNAECDKIVWVTDTVSRMKWMVKSRRILPEWGRTPLLTRTCGWHVWSWDDVPWTYICVYSFIGDGMFDFWFVRGLMWLRRESSSRSRMRRLRCLYPLDWSPIDYFESCG